MKADIVHGLYLADLATEEPAQDGEVFAQISYFKDVVGRFGSAVIVLAVCRTA